MRSPVILFGFVLLVPAIARAGGPPDPGMSFCGLSAPGVPCQYVSVADGSGDVLVVTATILDAGGAPVPFIPATCTLAPKGGSLAFCTCCANPQLGVTGAAGIVMFTFSAFAGRGLLDIVVEAGAVVVCIETIAFTSPDLNASCQGAPASSTTVVDLGIWAGNLPPGPFEAWADYDCSGAIGIVDLGVFAGGLGEGCAAVVCP